MKKTTLITHFFVFQVLLCFSFVCNVQRVSFTNVNNGRDQINIQGNSGGVHIHYHGSNNSELLVNALLSRLTASGDSSSQSVADVIEMIRLKELPENQLTPDSCTVFANQGIAVQSSSNGQSSTEKDEERDAVLADLLTCLDAREILEYTRTQATEPNHVKTDFKNVFDELGQPVLNALIADFSSIPMIKRIRDEGHLNVICKNMDYFAHTIAPGIDYLWLSFLSDHQQALARFKRERVRNLKIEQLKEKIEAIKKEHGKNQRLYEQTVAPVVRELEMIKNSKDHAIPSIDESKVFMINANSHSNAITARCPLCQQTEFGTKNYCSVCGTVVCSDCCQNKLKTQLSLDSAGSKFMLNRQGTERHVCNRCFVQSSPDALIKPDPPKCIFKGCGKVMTLTTGGYDGEWFCDQCHKRHSPDMPRYFCCEEHNYDICQPCGDGLTNEIQVGVEVEIHGQPDFKKSKFKDGEISGTVNASVLNGHKGKVVGKTHHTSGKGWYVEFDPKELKDKAPWLEEYDWKVEIMEARMTLPGQTPPTSGGGCNIS